MSGGQKGGFNCDEIMLLPFYAIVSRVHDKQLWSHENDIKLVDKQRNSVYLCISVNFRFLNLSRIYLDGKCDSYLPF